MKHDMLDMAQLMSSENRQSNVVFNIPSTIKGVYNRK